MWLDAGSRSAVGRAPDSCCQLLEKVCARSTHGDHSSKRLSK